MTRLRRRVRTTITLQEQLDALNEAVELATDRLPVDDVGFAAHVTDKAARRLRHGTDHTLVAVIGATGTGKSSLANAIAESPIATTGVRRPTTSSTLGLVWGEEDPSALLGWLGVGAHYRVESGRSELDGLVLLDVPDHDSIEVAHRLEMERIAEHADLLLWVTDPEKYADEAMHYYLRLLDHHDAVTVVVLNQADRLAPDDLTRCMADLTQLVRDDGLETTPVMAVSAMTGFGVPTLVEHLSEAVRGRETALDRLRADTITAAAALASHLGPEPYQAKLDGPLLARELTAASGAELVARAAGASYRRQARLSAGWPPTRLAGQLRPDPLRRLHLGADSGGRSSLPTPTKAQHARAAAAVRHFVHDATTDLPEPWPTLVTQAALHNPAQLQDELDRVISSAVRDYEQRRPRWWTLMAVLQWLFLATLITGIIWLTVLGVNAWLRLPDIDTPMLGIFPLPTALVAVGLAGGIIVSTLVRWWARIGGRRRRASVLTAVEDAVADLAFDHVVGPAQSELAVRERLGTLLARAGG